MEPEVFGAFASIRVRFSGNLPDLASTLAHTLNISVNVEPSEYPPYENIGYFETLGFEGSLQSDGSGSGWFRLRFETMLAVQEVFHNRLHDLSPWLARYVSEMCGLETKIAPRLADSDFVP